MASHPLTVLQILPALEGGGVERGVLETAEALAAAGHRSLVISRGGRLVAELERQGSRHISCPIGTKSPLTLRWVPWLRQIMLRERVNVIDVHSRWPAWMTYLAWKSLAAPIRPRLVSTFHGLHSVSRYSRIMGCGERVIVVSETMRQHVLENYPDLSPDRMVLIPRGVDPGEFPRGFSPDGKWKTDFFRQYPQLQGRPLVTLPGRITRLKGHGDFLLILARLREAGVSAHGLIVGSATQENSRYLQDLQLQIERLQLEDCVTFTGHRSDIKEIYAISKVVVSLSKKPESFGRTAAESLSIGTPVAGYSHGGIGEILNQQFPEGAVPFRDIDAAVKAITAILQSPVTPAVGENCFHKSQMLADTLRVYEDLCAPGRRAVA